MKSVVDAGLTGVLVASLMSLKQRPISFFEWRETAQISLNDRGTSSCLQAMKRQAAATASFALPLNCFSSCTCLKRFLQRSCTRWTTHREYFCGTRWSVVLLN